MFARLILPWTSLIQSGSPSAWAYLSSAPYSLLRYLKCSSGLGVTTILLNLDLSAASSVFVSYAVEVASNKSVWFMIAERLGGYYIAMYYDNGYNQAKGEDL